MERCTMPDEEASTHKADPLLTQHAIEHLEDQWRSVDEPTSITRKGHDVFEDGHTWVIRVSYD